MNKSLFLILIVFTVFFVSCEEKTTTYASCNPHCNEWETCNGNSGICELNNLRCIDSKDCKNNLEDSVCDNGICVEKSDSNFHLGVASAKLTRLSGCGNGAVKIYTDRAYPVHENSSYSITSYILDNDNGVSGYMGYILCEVL